ncbi:hypothetical protein BDV93DRAFT_515129 [Ceratobasidium sp. AG-I]|nr:hypothetical protein BDV93DRAFT_515129 [Ceratobasidium sp. AG-I]
MAPNTRQCTQCGAQFQSVNLLNAHIYDVHTRAGPSHNPVPQHTTIEKRECRHCSDSFTYAGLAQHLTRGTCAPLQERWQKQEARARRAHPTIPSSPPEGSSPKDREDGDVGGSSDIEYVDPVIGGGDEEMDYNDEEANNREGSEQEGPDGDHVNNRIYDAEDSEESEGEAPSSLESSYSVYNSEDMAEPHQDLPASPIHAHPPSDSIAEDEAGEHVILEEVVDQYGNGVYIQRYPIASAREQIRRATPEEINQTNYPDVGELAKPSFFEIRSLSVPADKKYCIQLRGMMPWKNNREFLKAVDKLPHGPNWTVQALKIKCNNQEEIFEVWMWNTLDIVKKILGSKQIGRFIEYKPVKKWTTHDRTTRIRDELNSGDWMWEVQGKIQEEHGTVISIIISSDKTRLTNFSGNKKAHPVYKTIGNLPKRLR